MKKIKIGKLTFIDSEALHEEMMKNSEYKKAYDALEPEFQIARQMINARIQKKITQEELAKKAGTGQAVISRLEGANAKPSISLLSRIASALGVEIKITIKPT